MMSPEEMKAKARERARTYYYANKERCLDRAEGDMTAEAQADFDALAVLLTK